MPTTLIASTRGSHHPLGATPVPGGVNFAVYSRHATAVNLLLFNAPEDAFPSAVFPLENRTRFVWHSLVHGLRPGQLYGYQVFGPWEPERGHRFDPRRLLMDPYARAIVGSFDRDWMLRTASAPPPPAGDRASIMVEEAQCAPKCVVVDNTFDWEDDAPPAIPMADTVIYETHVRGLSAHPSAAVRHPGTYLGVIEKIPYLASLGVTALEFLPVHHCQDDLSVARRGLTNYWGYMTLGYFAPDWRFSTRRQPGCQVNEFKALVKALHRAGLEVILDVVYSHTCEQGQDSPTLCWRGFDNSTYYALNEADSSRYVDWSGYGNGLDLGEPQVIKMIMDSLRYWVEEMHVDGFRFDLPSALGRHPGGASRAEALFCAIHQDPVLGRVKLISEPWTGSPHPHRFPIDWADWNKPYRDCVRRFTKGDAGTAAEMARRVTGSPDLYRTDGTTPYYGINLVTSHDGFTMRDLVSYSRKHNAPNLEGDADGDEVNHSWNWGAEGDTEEPQILAMRQRLIKNFMATLLLSHGVPMICGGDEILRTQKGNNNAYSQDNDINWYDWRLDTRQREMLRFVRSLISFRRKYPHFRAPNAHAPGRWFDALLRPLDETNHEVRLMALGIPALDEDRPAANEDVMLIFNAHWEAHPFRLPPSHGAGPWFRVLDTSLESGQEIAAQDPSFALEAQEHYEVAARSVVVLTRRGRRSQLGGLHQA